MNSKSLCGHHQVGQRCELEEHVPAEPELVVAHERAGDDRSRWDCGSHDPAPVVGCDRRPRVRPHRSPVVADQHGVGVAAERVVQRVRVDAQRARLVAAPGVERGRRVAAVERRHGPVAGCGEVGQEVPPGPRAVGVAVQAQGERTGARRQVRERRGRPHARCRARRGCRQQERSPRRGMLPAPPGRRDGRCGPRLRSQEPAASPFVHVLFVLRPSGRTTGGSMQGRHHEDDR